MIKNYNKHLKIKFLFLFLFLLFISILYIDYNKRLDMYSGNLSHDFRRYYDLKIQQYISASSLIADIINNKISDKNNKNTSKTMSTIKNILDTNEVSYAAIYSKDGDLLVDYPKNNSHKKLLFLNHHMLLLAVQSKSVYYGINVSSKAQNFTYIKPLYTDENLVGFAEVSFDINSIFKKSSDSTGVLIYFTYKKKAMYGDTISKEEDQDIKSRFNITKNSEFIIKKGTDKKEEFSEIIGSTILDSLKKYKEEDVSFLKFFIHQNSMYSSIVLPITNVNEELVGYAIAIQKDNQNLIILFIQLFKLIIGVLVFSFLYYIYKKNIKLENLLGQYKQAVDSTALVSKADINGIITYTNSAFEKISGYTKKELLHKSHSIIRAPEMDEVVFKGMWQTIKSGKIWKGKITNKKKNGERYIVNVNIFPIKNYVGKVVEYIAIRYDITELEAYRKLLKQKLISSNKDLKNNINLMEQYQGAIESSAAFMRIALSGEITYVNDVMIKISMLSEKEFLGKSIVHLKLLSQEQYENIKESILKNEKWHGVIECRHNKKLSCYLDATFSPIFQNNNIKELICISHDVTPIYHLYKEIEDTQKEVIYTMGAIGETRSKETGDHVKRVAEYSYLLAKLYGLNEKEAQLLKQASPMHDIGKVGIPDSILNKPGKLDKDEWVVMQTHAELGYEMLKHSTRDILKAASIVAHEHHEKWNGTGYPRGLSNENIHIYGRITSIADVFDALGHDRVYKKAWELEAILSLFKEQRGTSFDPELVDLFLDNIDEFLYVKSMFKN